MIETRALAGQFEAKGMSRVRFFLLNGFILGYLLLLPLLFATKYEVWPVCTYGMYQATFTHHDREHVVEYYTVAGGQEKWIDLMSGPILQWDYTFGTVIRKFGLTSPTTKKFLAASLEQIRVEAQTNDPQAPLPTALRVYANDYRYPVSGDYQPTLTHSVLLLEVDRGQP